MTRSPTVAPPAKPAPSLPRIPAATRPTTAGTFAPKGIPRQHMNALKPTPAPRPVATSAVPNPGVGTYTSPQGLTVKHSDLPAPVKAQVKHLGDLHALATSQGQDTSEHQRAINRLYDPSTRDADMARYTGEKMLKELSSRLAKNDKRYG
jgi:hypothetical protein